jgi:hypothetical protein
MTITKLPNGNLQMVANDHDKGVLRNLREYMAASEVEAEQLFVSELLNGYASDNGIVANFEMVLPEDVGALTDAPLITDGTDVWGYMDYQIKNFLEELIGGNTIEWIKG